MNLTDRNVELDQSACHQVCRLHRLKLVSTAMDDEEETLKDDLEDAQREFNVLIKVADVSPEVDRDLASPRQVAPSRIMVLMDEIYALQQKINALAHAPSIIQNDLRKLGSDLEGFRARDWWWLKTWRDGERKGHGQPP